jgi:hypothetical protein
MAKPALRLIDGDGEVHEAEGPDETIKALQSALARAERSIRQLKADKAAARKKHPSRADADSVWDEYKQTLGPKKRWKFTDDRVDAVLSLLDAGYTREEFSLMITGLERFQFVVYGKRRQTGAPDSREIDLDYIGSKARRFEELVVLGLHIQRERADAS